MIFILTTIAVGRAADECELHPLDSERVRHRVAVALRRTPRQLISQFEWQLRDRLRTRDRAETIEVYGADGRWKTFVRDGRGCKHGDGEPDAQLKCEAHAEILFDGADRGAVVLWRPHWAGWLGQPSTSRRPRTSD